MVLIFECCYTQFCFLLCYCVKILDDVCDIGECPLKVHMKLKNSVILVYVDIGQSAEDLPDFQYIFGNW